MLREKASLPRPSLSDGPGLLFAMLALASSSSWVRGRVRVGVRVGVGVRIRVRVRVGVGGRVGGRVGNRVSFLFTMLALASSSS